MRFEGEKVIGPVMRRYRLRRQRARFPISVSRNDYPRMQFPRTFSLATKPVNTLNHLANGRRLKNLRPRGTCTTDEQRIEAFSPEGAAPLTGSFRRSRQRRGHDTAGGEEPDSLHGWAGAEEE